MKIKIEIEDDMQERIDACKSELKENFIEYLKENPDIEDFDEYYQNAGCDSIHEIADSNTPIYYSDIDGLYFLYGSECDDAYNNAGCYDTQPENYKQVAIYFFLEEKTLEYMRELEEIFKDNIENGTKAVIEVLS